jgi:hypothetical protein
VLAVAAVRGPKGEAGDDLVLGQGRSMEEAVVASCCPRDGLGEKEGEARPASVCAHAYVYTLEHTSMQACYVPLVAGVESEEGGWLPRYIHIYSWA